MSQEKRQWEKISLLLVITVLFQSNDAWSTHFIVCWMEGDVRAQDLCYRQRVFSLSASKPSFLALVCPAWSGFPLGRGYITDSVVLLAVIPFSRGFECKGQRNKSVNTSCTCIQPASGPACSQTLILFSCWSFCIRFWVDLWFGAIYSKLLGVSIKR